MRAGQMLLPTVKEDPADWRVMQKITAIIRSEMDAIGWAAHSAVTAASKGDSAAALADARDAASLNPLAAEPLLTEALVL